MKKIYICIIFTAIAVLGFTQQKQGGLYLAEVEKNNAKKITSNKVINSSALVTNLSFKKNEFLSGISVNAKIKLNSYDSYVRIILESPSNGEELLIHESYYPKNSIEKEIIITDASIETALIESNFSDGHIKIEIHNANCTLLDYTYAIKDPSLSFEKNSKNLMLEYRKNENSLTIGSLNKQIQSDGSLWVAGETGLSLLPYKERKQIVGLNERGEMKNMQGLEYYIGGVFELKGITESSSAKSSSSYVKSFDWRNRHGANNSSSAYYNSANGWITSVKDQGFSCGSCSVFSVMGTIEALANLYFNKPLNLDLSEQEIISCFSDGGDCVRGWRQNTVIDYIKSSGVSEESCFPYYGMEKPCYNKCPNPLDKIRISGRIDCRTSAFPETEDAFKYHIINHGPICDGIESLDHAMTMIGYKELQAGDIVYANLSNTISIPANSNKIGKTAWLFKNSWGASWGNQGFCYILPNSVSDIGWRTHTILSPITSNIHKPENIPCYDKDGDGYYYWGIGPKPSTCPSCAFDEPDGDDSNPNLGPMDQYGNCAPLENITTSQTWSTNKTLSKDLIVNTGATLTISATLTMEPNHRIIIRNGGKLIVSGGIIDNGNLIAQSGGSVQISNNGKIYLNSYDNFNIVSGAILDYTYGGILLK